MRKKILFIYNEGLIIRDIEKGELIFTEQVFIITLRKDWAHLATFR